MFTSKTLDDCVLDLGFLSLPLAQRLVPAMTIHVHNSRKRQGFGSALAALIHRTCGPSLRSIWKCFA